jgi:phospholipid/cholesterol/gamma-HCH transport system permease protein
VLPASPTNATRLNASESVANVVRRDDDRIRLSGVLRTRDAAALWSAVRTAVLDLRPGARVTLDMSAVASVQGNVMALLVEVRARLARRGVEAEFTGMREPVAKLAELYAAARPPAPAARPRRESVVAQVGATTLAHVARVEAALGFLGSLVLAGLGRRRRHRAAHWGEIVSLVEQTGAEAMAIVFAIVFVVGFIFSYSTADTFIELGQRLLSARIIGKAITREIAPVITAFIVAGRAGAAFAAEIGSMKVDHEIDALRTFGLEPFGWLAVPRLVALVMAVPGLVIVADFFGFAGGALVGVTSLGLSLPVYVHALRSAVSAWDVVSGIIKSAAFGLTIALVGCQQGFAVSGGPEEVGRRTTSAVVAGIFFTVVDDAILTVVYKAFGG